MHVGSSSAIVATTNADIFKVLLASDGYAIPTTYVVIFFPVEGIIHSSQELHDSLAKPLPRKGLLIVCPISYLSFR